MIKNKSINPVIFALVILLAIFIGGYYLFSLIIMHQFQKAIVESIKKAAKYEDQLPEVLTDTQEHLYVGSDNRNGIKIVNDIFLKG